TYDEAASVPLVFLTAWHMLVGRASLRAGEIVLVLGGGSGVGTAAVQIAKMLGARVIATAGDETKLLKCQELGADYTINHFSSKLKPVVDKTYPLREAGAAHERLEAGQQFGKIVLNP